MRPILVSSGLVAGLLGCGLAHAQTSSPGTRAGAYMVYDAAHGQTLLFGGWTSQGAGAEHVYPDDLWAWDGSSWRKLEPVANTPRPAGRDVPVLAYDAARDRVVMFGGRGDGTGQPANWLTDVWEWDGARWYRITNTGMPQILHPVAGYDPARRRVVVYGGGLVNGSGAFAGFSRTLWEWDGVRWSARDTAGPANQVPGALTTTREGAIIMLGGQLAVNRDAPRAPVTYMGHERLGMDGSRGGARVQQLARCRGRARRNTLHVSVVGGLAHVAVDARTRCERRLAPS
jgi:hypothetical protein